MTEAQKRARYGPIVAQVMSSKGGKSYEVRQLGESFSCTCMGWRFNKTCRHAEVTQRQSEERGDVDRYFGNLQSQVTNAAMTAAAMKASQGMMSAKIARQILRRGETAEAAIDPVVEALREACAVAGVVHEIGEVRLRVIAAGLRERLTIVPAAHERAQHSDVGDIGVRTIILDD